MGHIGNLHIVEDLYISLGHLHTDIVLSLLQIGCGCLKVQLAQLNLVRNLEARKDGHARRELQRCITSVGIGVSILCGQTTSEREVLSETSTQIWKSRVLSRGELKLLLATLVLLLLDADVMLYSIVTTLAQAPLLLRTCCAKGQRKNDE